MPFGGNLQEAYNVKIKESSKETFVPSTIKSFIAVDRIFGPKDREKAWQRAMRHRLFAIEQRLDQIEDLIKDLHKKELGV